MCFIVKRNNSFGNFSHIKPTSVSHEMNKKASHYLFSKGPANNTVPILLENMDLRRNKFEKEVLLLSHMKSLFHCRRKNESQVQGNSTHYLLRLEMYKNQYKQVLTHFVKCEN